MAPKRSLPAAKGKAAAAPAAKGKGKAAAAEEGSSSGSEDLVSHSDDDEDDSGGSGSEDDDDAPQEPAPDDGDGSDFDELQVDFEFFDLKPIDFHGLRALFQRYLDGELPFALSELVEALIAQANSVGTVVKANGDVDPLGVVSVLPLDRHRQSPAVQQILAFMRRKCPSAQVAAFDAAVAAPRLGLLLSERMLNTPPELAPPLTSGLFEEIADVGGEWWWQTEAAPTEALRKSYEFDRFLILTRVYRDEASDEEDGGAGPSSGGASRPAPAKKAKTAPSAGAAAGAKLVYPKSEDEAFHAHAAWSFLFPAAVPEATAVADRANKLTQMRLVMCVEASAAAAVQRDTERAVAALAAAPAQPRRK